jgi:hypothetical protein
LLAFTISASEQLCEPISIILNEENPVIFALNILVDVRHHFKIN